MGIIRKIWNGFLNIVTWIFQDDKVGNPRYRAITGYIRLHGSDKK